MLSINDSPLFESNAIAEYLDEANSPQLHPTDPIKRARNRAWTDFVPDFSRQLGKVSYAKTKEDLEAAVSEPPTGLQRLEDAIKDERDNDGPYFNGDQLSLVDASYAPFLQRFSLVEKILQTGLLSAYPRIQQWTDALLANDCVKNSVAPEFQEVFQEGLRQRGGYVAELMR